jgi:hypothetical protein
MRIIADPTDAVDRAGVPALRGWKVKKPVEGPLLSRRVHRIPEGKYEWPPSGGWKRGKGSGRAANEVPAGEWRGEAAFYDGSRMGFLLAGLVDAVGVEAEKEPPKMVYA